MTSNCSWVENRRVSPAGASASSSTPASLTMRIRVAAEVDTTSSSGERLAACSGNDAAWGAVESLVAGVATADDLCSARRVWYLCHTQRPP